MGTSNENRRKAIHLAIAAYAAEMAGTDFDLDPALEIAGISHLEASNLTTPPPPSPTAAPTQDMPP